MLIFLFVFNYIVPDIGNILIKVDAVHLLIANKIFNFELNLLETNEGVVLVTLHELVSQVTIRVVDQGMLRVLLNYFCLNIFHKNCHNPSLQLKSQVQVSSPIFKSKLGVKVNFKV